MSLSHWAQSFMAALQVSQAIKCLHGRKRTLTSSSPQIWQSFFLVSLLCSSLNFLCLEFIGFLGSWFAVGWDPERILSLRKSSSVVVKALAPLLFPPANSALSGCSDSLAAGFVG